MAGLPDIVDSLENKLKKLHRKLEQLEHINRELQHKITASEITVSSQSQEIALLKEETETLKTANSLLGSDDNKRETKLKINSLIREIDYCIAQLSD